MYKRRISVSFIIIMIITIVLIGLPSQTQGAKFVIASWEGFPDEYGQGIYGVWPFENSTGSFINILNPDTGIGLCYSDNTTSYELNFTADTALRFDVRVFLNYTNLGLTHPDDIDLGINFVRVSVEMFALGVSVFFQQNLTYDYQNGFVETGIWYYSVVGTVDVILVAGTTYIVRFVYEIFY